MSSLKEDIVSIKEITEFMQGEMLKSNKLPDARSYSLQKNERKQSNPDKMVDIIQYEERINQLEQEKDLLIEENKNMTNYINQLKLNSGSDAINLSQMQ